MNRTCVLGAIFLAILVGACADGAGGSGSPPETYAEFRKRADQAVGDAACAGTFRCPEEQRPFFVVQAGRYQDEATCRRRVVSDAGAGQVRASEQAALEYGRVTYDQEQALECLAQLRALRTERCPSSAELQHVQRTVCASVLKPGQSGDEPCDQDFECLSGHCLEDDASACRGSCLAVVEPVALGEVCGSASCKDGALCEQSTDPETGFSYRCVEAGSRKRGEMCTTTAACEDGLTCEQPGYCTALPTVVAEGKSCDLSSRICQPSLVCVGIVRHSSDQTGVCEPPRAQGEACRSDFECRPGLFCSPGSTPQAGQCEAFKKEGEMCPRSPDPHGAGLHLACEGELRCERDGPTEPYRCVEAPAESGADQCTARGDR